MQTNEKIIACIPSKTMREFLTANPIKMSGLSSKLCMKIFLGYFRKTSRVPYVEIAQCFRPIAYRHRPLRLYNELCKRKKHRRLEL